MNYPKKIVAIGPESTGKSTLCEELAAHYGTLWCPEFAREYLLKYGPQYTYEDLLKIAKGQIELEDGCLQEASSKLHKRVFIDTDMYVMKVWSEFVFDRCHRYILDQVAERKYDLYLLCNTDLPWVKDELREYPDLETRQKLFFVYKDLLINQDVPWVEIKGNESSRLQAAIQAIEKLHL